MFAPNTPPTISDIPDQSTKPGVPVGPISFVVGDAETAAAGLVTEAALSGTAQMLVSGVALGGSGANRTLTITPTTGITGMGIITITVRDSELETAYDTFSLTVELFRVYLPLIVNH